LSDSIVDCYCSIKSCRAIYFKCTFNVGVFTIQGNVWGAVAYFEVTGEDVSEARTDCRGKSDVS
jgi:hypothetical protein